jgi:hypothetical protein
LITTENNYLVGNLGHFLIQTYFTFKEHFIREKYTFLNDFKVRQAICKIRISAHPLMIEIGRYKNLETKNDYVNCA